MLKKADLKKGQELTDDYKPPLNYSHRSEGSSMLLPSRSNPSISSCRDKNKSSLVFFFRNVNSFKGVYNIIIEYNKYIWYTSNFLCSNVTLMHSFLLDYKFWGDE